MIIHVGAPPTPRHEPYILLTFGPHLTGLRAAGANSGKQRRNPAAAPSAVTIAVIGSIRQAPSS
jgi:hypothetical protein